MAKVLIHSEGKVFLEALSEARIKITVELTHPNIFSPRTSWETNYGEDLIEHILKIKGAAWLCDEIARDEDPEYVRKNLQNELFAYFDAKDFAGKRILDFGCGSGASTSILACLFPASEIAGIDLYPELLEIARHRVQFYNFSNVVLRQSPSPDNLPPDLGEFDFVILSAVFEHFLPAERQKLVPKIWETVRNGGFLFLNQTPNRLFPLELHTTMLPFINYLPDKLAHLAARRFAKRVQQDESWEMLLRRGIRGATVGEIRRLLQGSRLILPTKNGIKDRVDLYYLTTNPKRKKIAKSIAKGVLKMINFATGIAIVPELALVFKKISPPEK
ncbi:MAG: methyltransferase domain-containing protein [Acidobacteriota bacterium]|nr:methyltransferase domain-containing protein [Acidobacteriota bacterium]